MALTAAVAAVVVPTASAVDTPVPLPSPAQQLSPSPPLRTTAFQFELRLPGSVSSRQLVDVGIGPGGSAVSVRVHQRLTLEGKGDYSFAVQAPAIDVRPARGSESEPGLRRDAILWQGFSPGRRVLGASALLRPSESIPSLPLGISLDARVGGLPLSRNGRTSGLLDLRLVVRNVTGTRSATFGGVGEPRELAGVLDRLRFSIESGSALATDLVHVAGGSSGLRATSVRVEAPLEVRGVVRFPHGNLADVSASGGRASLRGITFHARLGDGAPLELHVRARAHARGLDAPVVEIEAAPVLALSTLRPPGGGTWRDAVERGRVPANGRSLLATTIGTILRVARARQYEMFLANPDLQARGGADRTVYRFRTAPARPAALPSPGRKGESGLLVPLLLAVSGVAAAAALVVGWAHL